MVKNKATLRIALRQNNNEDSKAFGKWYPEIDQSETISMRALCNHMESHGSLYTRETIEAVMQRHQVMRAEARRILSLLGHTEITEITEIEPLAQGCALSFKIFRRKILSVFSVISV
ncbi:hypothetical protein [Prevotella sp. E2-28]|uniref:hypothetical protein n=1 Tax=Prevotella sp. E2-28 TaxID=2913620 RepID=UPI001EDB8A71|nr:hypothetical protein [Prevotella sp. E2-28]UKK54470.1 hypothetical protein L6465_04210 [Prevotella sp. E2-28]